MESYNEAKLKKPNSSPILKSKILKSDYHTQIINFILSKDQAMNDLNYLDDLEDTIIENKIENKSSKDDESENDDIKSHSSDDSHLIKYESNVSNSSYYHKILMKYINSAEL